MVIDCGVVVCDEVPKIEVVLVIRNMLRFPKRSYEITIFVNGLDKKWWNLE